MHRALLLICACLLSGCFLRPEASACGDALCIEPDQEVYHPSDRVLVTIYNETPRTVYLDRCSGGIEGFDEARGEWNGSYGVQRICAPFPSHEDVLAHMRAIPASGGILTDTLHINSRAYEGRWRVWYRFLDEEGAPWKEGVWTSAPFQVVHE